MFSNEFLGLWKTSFKTLCQRLTQSLVWENWNEVKTYQSGSADSCYISYSWTLCFSPQNCVGFLFLDLHPVPLLRPASAPASSHTFTHNKFVTHTQLCHTLSHTHNFVTHTHTTLSHGDVHRHFAWQAWHLVTSAVHRHFAWQAWHLVTSAVVSRGRRGTWWHLPSFCVAGVLLMGLGWLWWRAWFPVTPRYFAWQALHLVTSAFASRCRRGTWWHPPFVWQACYLWDWAGSGGALGPPWRRATLRGRRGTWWHPPSFHVAGVALGGIYLRFTGQAWNLVTHTH